MIWNSRIVAALEKWQDSLLKEYQGGQTIHFRKLRDRFWVAYSEDGHGGANAGRLRRKFIGMLPRVKAIVVGVDIREYSRRTPEQQLFLTLNLHACIETAIKLLQDAAILTPNEPYSIIQTGDGAYVVFSFLRVHNNARQESIDESLEKIAWFGKGSIKPPKARKEAEQQDGEVVKEMTEAWKFERGMQEVEKQVSDAMKEQHDKESAYLPEASEQAISFVFALNALMNSDNVRQGLVVDDERGSHNRDGFPVFPTECRFAVSFDEVLLLKTQTALNCVGSGMVTCARILATDHGSHLLIDYELLKELEPHGGLMSLCGGAWEHRLHSAVLPETKVKSGHFRFADVFGFHHDGPLLRALGRVHHEPTLYHIGSHNVTSIDSAA